MVFLTLNVLDEGVRDLLSSHEASSKIFSCSSPAKTWERGLTEGNFSVNGIVRLLSQAGNVKIVSGWQ